MCGREAAWPKVWSSNGLCMTPLDVEKPHEEAAGQPEQFTEASVDLAQATYQDQRTD